MNFQEIKDNSQLRFYLLNEDTILIEIIVCVPGLKIGFPDLLKKAQGILENFINLCLDKWAEDYKEGWNVGMFDVIITN